MRELPIYNGIPQLAIETVSSQLLDRNCGKCSLSKGVRSICMSAELAGQETGPTLLVVGRGPGDVEDRAGRPMVGVSGSYFRDLLTKLWAGRVVYDNAVRCAPGARKITPAMVDACRGYGRDVFLRANPDRILALGTEAVRSILGESSSTRRGYTYTSTGVPVMFLTHPAAAMRNRFVRGWFEEDLEWAIKSSPRKPPYGAVAKVVTTVEEAHEAAEYLELWAPWVTWDVETFGAPFNQMFSILNLALTPGGEDWAYVLERDALDNPAVLGPIRRVLENKKIKKGGHNLKFDLVCARAKYGIESRADYDTLLYRRLLDADSEAALEICQPMVGMTGGKEEAEGYVKEGVKLLRKLVKKPELMLTESLFQPTPGDVRDVVELQEAVRRVALGDEPRRYAYKAIPSDVRTRYNGTDTISADKIKLHFDERMAQRPDIQNVWDTVVHKMAHAITVMEYNGIAVSRPKIAELQALADQRMADVRGRLTQYDIGPNEPFNPNSQAHVQQLFFDSTRFGLKPTAWTSGGTKGVKKPSAAAGVLEEIAEKYKGKAAGQAALDIIEFRRASHFKSQYADGMEFFVQDDGRIHPSINIAGTSTGRPSCQDPNLLNIPRPETPEGVLCRDVFIAPPGYKLVEFDQSQIELRVAAMLSGDDVMIALFQDPNMDFHAETARMIAPAFSVDPATITKDHWLRSQAKIVNFSVLYGKEAKGLAYDLSISVKDAQKLIDSILGKFWKLKRWIGEQLAFARKNGYCRTWWAGKPFRERPLWRIGDHDDEARQTAERSSWNTPVQGTAAEFTNASLGAMQEWIEEEFVPAKLVLTVYDSIVLEVRDDAVPEVVGRGREIMEGWESCGVPLKADVKVGESWGSLTKLKAA